MTTDQFPGQARAPVAVKGLVLRLEKKKTLVPTYEYTGEFALRIEYDVGDTDDYVGNVLPILPPDMLQELRAMMDELWAMAESHLGIGG